MTAAFTCSTSHVSHTLFHSLRKKKVSNMKRPYRTHNHTILYSLYCSTVAILQRYSTKNSPRNLFLFPSASPLFPIQNNQGDAIPAYFLIFDPSCTVFIKDATLYASRASSALFTCLKTKAVPFISVKMYIER